MESFGIVRKLDPLGRIVLPIETRKKFSIYEGSPLEIFVEGNKIVLKKYDPGCIFCGEVNKTVTFEGKNVCVQLLKN